MKKLISFFVLLTMLISMPVSVYADAETRRLHDLSMEDEDTNNIQLTEAAPAEAVYAPPIEAPVKATGMTLMVYLCGSNLEAELASASLDICEMYASGFNAEEINVVIMAGGSPVWHLEEIPDHTTGIYRLVPGVGLIPLKNHDSLYNMGEADTLSSFLDYAYETFPAEHYALILWDHGGGALNGICQDVNFGGKSLSMFELDSAMLNSPFAQKKLDWIGFDACLMSTAETAMIVMPYADYMIASEDSEPASGWDYSFLGSMRLEDSAETVGTLIADTYSASCNAKRAPSVAAPTMACVDLKKLDDMVIAMDDFFGSISMTRSEFAAVSRMRSKLYSFGTGAEFDLVDLANVITGVSELSSPAALELLSQSLKDCVRYSVPKDARFNGLTVYFPYYEKYALPTWANDYQSLRFSEGYKGFINSFCSFLMQNESDVFSHMETNMQMSRDNRTIINMALSEEQLEDFCSAEIIALQQALDGSGWHLVATQKAELADHSLNGQYIHTNLFVTDANLVPLHAIPLLYEEQLDNSFVVPVVLVKENGESTPARLICRQDESGHLFVETALLYDEVLGGYSPRLSLSKEELRDSFKDARFDVTDRLPQFYSEDTQSALLPYEKWPVEQVSTYSWSLDEPWELAFVRDQLDPQTLAVAFKITDIFNNTYLGQTIGLNGDLPDPDSDLSVYLLKYDDNDLLLLDESSFTLQPDGMLFLSLSNITDTEKLVVMENVHVNGNLTDFSAAVSGSGEAGGLLPNESSICFLELPLNEGEQITELSFDFLLSEPDGTDSGSVTVTVSRSM